jgi:DUF971 family protein
MIKPTKIHLHKQSKILEIGFSDGALEPLYLLAAEFLRTHSPSAEVRGHGVGQEVLVTGKIDVGINSINAVGQYGLQIHFDDGHNSGIFSWEYLQDLGLHQAEYWQAYLEKIDHAKKSRDPNTRVVQFMPL